MENNIYEIMKVTLENIKNIVDVDTIIGKGIETGNGIAIPISKVSLAFLSGGGDINSSPDSNKTEDLNKTKPFLGGGGAGLTIQPIAFLIINQDQYRIITVEQSNSLNKIIDCFPDIINKFVKKSDDYE